MSEDAEPDFLEQAPPPPPDEGRFKVVVIPYDASCGLGFSLEGSGPAEVFAVAPGSIADSLGIVPGDAVFSVNGTNVSDQPHDVVAEIMASYAPEPVELALMTAPSATPHIAVVETSSATMLQVEQLKGKMDAPPPIGEEERKSFRPFSSLELLIEHRAHLSVFLHYLMSNGILVNETLCFLNIEWFNSKPEKVDAMTFFEDFLATTAPLRLSDIPPDLFASIEQTLNLKSPDPAKFTELFEQVAALILPPVKLGLAKFEELVSQQLGSLYGVNKLVGLAQVDEAAFIQEIMSPHLEQIRSCPKERQKYCEVVADSLLQLMSRSGVNVQSHEARLGFGERSTRRKGKADSSIFGQRKIHLHAGHHFVTTSYQHPTFCGVCKTLLWGVIKQGWDCVDCGFHVHKSNDMTGHRKCHTIISQICPGTKQKKQKWDLSKYPKKIMRSRSSTRSQGSGLSPSASRKGSSRSHSSTTSSELKEPSSPISGFSPSASIRSTVSMIMYDDTLEFDLPCDMTGEPENWVDTIKDEKMVKKLEKNEISRQNHIYELIQTEKGYFRHLHILQQLFRQPLMDEGILPAADLISLFSNVDELVEMNRPLFTELKKFQEQHKGQVVKNIGALFIESFKKIDPHAYAVFCSNQTLASQFYHEKKASYSAFHNKLKQSEAHPVAERLTFLDFIAKPLQRLTKYPLLLKGILKHTHKKEKEEIAALEQAVELADGVLKYVQSEIKKIEDAARLRELNNKIDASSASAQEASMVRDLHLSGRQLIREGPLQLRVQDKLADVHVVLLTDIILLLYTKEDKYLLKPGVGRSPVVLLGSVVVRGVATDPRAFFVISTSRVGTLSAGPQMFEFVAATKRGSAEWMEAIAAAAESFKAANPDWELRHQQQAAQHNEAADDSASDGEEELQLEMTLGQLIEQMRTNCEVNRQLLGRVNQALSSTGFGVDAVAEVQASDDVAAAAAEAGEEQANDWLALQLARTLERCTAMQTRLAELGVQLYAAREDSSTALVAREPNTREDGDSVGCEEERTETQAQLEQSDNEVSEVSNAVATGAKKLVEHEEAQPPPMEQQESMADIAQPGSPGSTSASEGGASSSGGGEKLSRTPTSRRARVTLGRGRRGGPDDGHESFI